MRRGSGSGAGKHTARRRDRQPTSDAAIRYAPSVETVADNVEATITTRAAVCWQCGYDLSHTPADSRCPECGLAVQESVRNWDELPTLGRPRDVAAASLLVVLAAIVFAGGYAGLMFIAYLLFGASLDIPELVIMAAAFVVSVLPCVLLLLAARRVRPKLIGGRGIGLAHFVAWVLLTGVLAGWGFVAIEETGLFDIGYRLEEAIAITLAVTTGTAAVLIVPLIQKPLTRRMRAWPSWCWLRRSIGITRLILLAAAVAGLIAVYTYMIATLGFDWEPYIYSRSYSSYTTYTPPVEKTGSIVFRYALGTSAILYGLALLAALTLFLITIFAGRRIARHWTDNLTMRGFPMD